MQLVPTGFFTTSGSAISKVSDLNAFDDALMEAGISEQNLVAVSSIIPIGAKEVEKKELPMGMITHCVLAQMRGVGKGTISAGIAYTYRLDGKGGYVAEGHINGSKEMLRKELEGKMNEMARMRNIKFGEIHYIVEDIEIPEGNYGCCIASLVFTEYK